MHRRFISLLFFLEAVFVSAIVRFALSFLPSSVRLSWMGHPVDPTNTEFQAHLSPEIPLEQKQITTAVKLAVTRVDRYVPWGTECYTQALTAKLMLRRRGVSTLLLVGFRKSEKGEIQGHAWLKIGPYFITGFRHDMDTYVVNGKFL